MRTIELLSPAAAVAANTVPLAKGVPALGGRVIGLLNNSKAGTRPFLDRVAELLRRDHGVSKIVPGTAPPELELNGRFNLTFRQY